MGVEIDIIKVNRQWADEIKNVESGNERGKRKDVSLAMIAANNHYAVLDLGLQTYLEKWLGCQNYLGRIGTNYRNDLNYESDNYSSWNKISKLETLLKCLQRMLKKDKVVL
ncbi:MAG TPA: hypothetical protein VFR94_18345 [Nitrososphaeraceae archaeon]|nr:hypothetical protein [Nitrososphaeraceae archaeon]